VNNEHRLYERPVRQLFIFALALLMATQVALSLYAWSLSEHKLLPELGRKAQTAGQSLGHKLERALDYGIPLAQVEGVPDFFAEVLKQNSDLAYLRVTDLHGAVLYQSAQADTAADDEFLDTSIILRHDAAAVGALHVGVDQRYIAARVRELRYDIGIVLLTSLLIAFEILWFVVTLNFTAPMRQIVSLMSRIAAGDFRHRAQAGGQSSLAERLNGIGSRVNLGFTGLRDKAAAIGGNDPRRRDSSESVLQRLRGMYAFAESGAADDLTQQRIVLVRVLSFLFMFAEMLSRPFLPVYAASLSGSGLDMPEGMRASLPITAFLLGVALTMPFAGRWSDQVGRRSSYIAGALLVMAGLATTGMVPQYLVLVAARACTGIGYALMFMACQGFVFDNTDSGNRGKGMALFVGAIMVAEICSPAVGGILADRIGYRMVFILGAAVALAAAGIAAAVLDNRSRVAGNVASPGHVAGARARTPLLQLAHNRRFLALSILSGVPAKFLYSGFMIFLVPLLLTGLGNSKSEIGRYTMLYGLSCLLLAPLFARIADRYNAYALLVAIGGLLTGAGMLPVLQGASANLVMLGVAALGVGQAMSISAQLVLVARVTQAEARVAGTGPIMGVFRLLERLGAAAGPIVTGALVAQWGAQQAMATLGAVGLCSSALFALVFLLSGRRSGSNAGGEVAA
jgi:MFS family permease/HAMP domain-containing protein